jgi:hypothetical protein
MLIERESLLNKSTNNHFDGDRWDQLDCFGGERRGRVLAEEESDGEQMVKEARKGSDHGPQTGLNRDKLRTQLSTGLW